MTFLFEDISTGEIRYIIAPFLADAINIFESHQEFSDTSDFEHVNVFVRII